MNGPLRQAQGERKNGWWVSLRCTHPTPLGVVNVTHDKQNSGFQKVFLKPAACNLNY